MFLTEYDSTCFRVARMNTKDVGDLTEATIIHELVSRGYSVAIPFGDNDRYDLVADCAGKLYRLQCKTGWKEDGCIRFKTCSKTTVDGAVKTVDYDGQIDAFAVRCKEDEQLYWVPETDTGKKSTYLRVTEPEIDHPKINFAEEYMFENNLPRVT